MFRFWYRYVFTNRTLIETGAVEAVWSKKIEPDYNNYMGLVFEKVCMDYMDAQNVQGNLPILFTRIGRWWGTDPVEKTQVEIDLIASDGNDYIIGECKWRKNKIEMKVLEELKKKADVFRKKRRRTWYVLFSKSGFSESVIEEAQKDESILLVGLDDIMRKEVSAVL